MALWDDLTGSLSSSWTTNILVGGIVILVAPVVVPAVVAGIRPLAKMLIKGGVMAYDKAAEAVAEMGEQVSDLVAEARAELTTTTTEPAASSSSSSGSSSIITPYNT